MFKSGVCRDGAGAVVKQMATSGCHENIVAIIKKHPKYVAWTGLALSDDGIWRIHSWVTDEHMRIIETTTPRIKYFGFAFKLPK